MSEKKISIQLGGKHAFFVRKAVDEGNNERFEVGMGDDTYRNSTYIASAATWAEAMNAIRGFADEVTVAMDALLDLSELAIPAPSGASNND